MSFLDTVLSVGSDIKEQLRRLPRKAEELAMDTQMLKGLKDDLWSQAENEARWNGGALSNQLSAWVKSVENLVAAVDDFKTSYDNVGSFRLDTKSSLAKDVVDLLQRVATLTEKGNSLSDRGQWWQQPGLHAVQPVPAEISSATSLVGAAEPLQKIKDCIMNQHDGIIGIYGMGGVGKTTLLNIINNEFLMRSEGRGMFDVAIWVTVSREAKDIPRIQKTIADRLRLSSNVPVDKDTLFRELIKRRFVLLLDDVWERLDLVGELGVPLPKDSNNNSKILFTTRSEQVCRVMDADVLVKVGCLDEDSSWELFRSKFGKKDGHHRVLDDDPVIKPLAKEVVKRCGGLPISLITVGRAMAQAKTADDWRDAITKLDHRPAGLGADMEKDVLLRLRFSFDMLRCKTLRDCLLYFALFPEDGDIWKEGIIDLWICEGLLDSEEFDELDIEDTRRRGHTLITELQNACLVEVDDERPQCVRLHDTVRDMAVWICKKEFMVLAGRSCFSSQVPTLAIWQKATRISLIDNEQIEEPSSSCWDLSCPNLTTFLLQSSRLGKNVSHNQGFLTCTNMPALRVLNLSEVGLRELPISITSLISLRYLSLESNYLTSLPVQLGNLVNLRQLDLSYNKVLQPIPRAALSRLSSLQVLKMVGCGDQDDQQQSELEVLKNLTSLCELHLRGDGVCSWESLQVIAESPALRRSIRELQLYSSLQPPQTGETISQRIHWLQRINILKLRADRNNPVKGELMLYSGRLQHLQNLSIRYFIDSKISIIKDEIAINRGEETPLFPRLACLEIEGCRCYDLTWIERLPCLDNLEVENCDNLTDILLSDGSNDEKINDQTAPPSSLFFLPKLRQMRLSNLRSLRSISTRTLLLPSLKALYVNGCPELRRLPWNGKLPCLTKLSVVSCEKLTEILSDGKRDDIDDQTVGSFFPMLEVMKLLFLPSLRSISTRTLIWHSLVELIVKGCPELRRLPRIDELPRLRVLEVGNCEKLTEILSDGEDDNDDQPVGSFPSLWEMILWDLPSLRSISTRTLLRIPLEVLIVRGCPELRRLPWSDGLPRLNELKVENCGKLAEILADGKDDHIADQTVGSFFPCLRQMTLLNLPSLRSISTHTWPPPLEVLIVNECPELRRLPWSDGFLCLERLCVQNCGKITEILSDGEKEDIDDQTVDSFPKLWNMELDNLPSLRSISTRTLVLPSLKLLIVKGCPELRRPPKNVRLPCLEKLEVENCGKLTEILFDGDDKNKDIDDQTILFTETLSDGSNEDMNIDDQTIPLKEILSDGSDEDSNDQTMQLTETLSDGSNEDMNMDDQLLKAMLSDGSVEDDQTIPLTEILSDGSDEDSNDQTMQLTETLFEDMNMDDQLPKAVLSDGSNEDMNMDDQLHKAILYDGSNEDMNMDDQLLRYHRERKKKNFWI